MIRKIARYGWRPDTPDHRDYKFHLSVHYLKDLPLPSSMDLRSHCAPVDDQGELGSCTANAISGALKFDILKSGELLYNPSRLFVYYNERVIEGNTSSDSGAELRDGMKVISGNGWCDETEWPYDITKFAVKPSDQCYQDAIAHKAINYFRINQDLNDMKTCLASGFPFVFGFTVYDSFESTQVATTGIVPMPSWCAQAVGGHAVCAVGYDDTNSWVVVRNSWGPNWGDKGYFYLPYDYISSDNLASDFWTIRSISK